jgi:2-oxoisovalerate dehydrogenase E1 component
MVNVMNNGYGMGGQTIGETMGNKGPARIGSAINPDALHAEVVNGQNPLAVMDLIRRKYPIVKNGDGPVMNEIRTYRFNGHSSGDLESYRTSEEVNA